jgi:hypothetical protein
MANTHPTRRDFLAATTGLLLVGCAARANVPRQGNVPDTLNLNTMMQPLETRSVLRNPDWFIWGGGCVKALDGTYHMLFARWPKKEGFNAWVTHSEIAHATAPDPLGPWTVTGPVFARRPGFWDADNLHNPLAQKFEGKYYLYYSGNYGPRDGTRDGWWIHRNNQRAGVAVADHLLTNSPTVARRRDGKYVLIYKGVADGPKPFGGKVRMHVALGDSPTGPFVKQPGTVFGHETL